MVAGAPASSPAGLNETGVPVVANEPSPNVPPTIHVQQMTDNQMERQRQAQQQNPQTQPGTPVTPNSTPALRKTYPVLSLVAREWVESGTE